MAQETPRRRRLRARKLVAARPLRGRRPARARSSPRSTRREISAGRSPGCRVERCSLVRGTAIASPTAPARPSASSPETARGTTCSPRASTRLHRPGTACPSDRLRRPARSRHLVNADTRAPAWTSRPARFRPRSPGSPAAAARRPRSGRRCAFSHARMAQPVQADRASGREASARDLADRPAALTAHSARRTQGSILLVHPMHPWLSPGRSSRCRRVQQHRLVTRRSDGCLHRGPARPIGLHQARHPLRRDRTRPGGLLDRAARSTPTGRPELRRLVLLCRTPTVRDVVDGSPALRQPVASWTSPPG